METLELLDEDGGAVFDVDRFPPPRAFQNVAHDGLREGARAGHKRQLLCSPTGSGKTYLGLRAIFEALCRHRRALFCCDRITLIEQTSATADRYGLKHHGIIQADHWRTLRNAPFQVASAQTLARRGWPKDLDLIIVDECHTKLAAWVEFVETFEGHVIGLSATPFSKGLGNIFTNLVVAATMAELVEASVLVPLRPFTCTPANMKDAATSGGEWTQGAAAERGLAIVGQVVDEWQKFGEGRKTICFGSTIAHCEDLCRQFNEAGVMAAVFCADTTPSERAEALKNFSGPDSLLRVLISVEALAKGFDVPDVGCIIDCRPLRKGFSTWVQMIGRGLRSSPETGKSDCILLDHTGNVVRFAHDFEEFYFNGIASLKDGETLDSRIRKDDPDLERSACPKCGYKPFAGRCVSCGHKKQRTSTVVHELGKGMREIVIGKTKLADSRQHLWAQYVSYVRERGQKPGFASHLYKDTVGHWPPSYFDFNNTPSVPVSKAVKNRIAARIIAYGSKPKATG